MITAQELRIGNWVKYSGNWCYRKCPTGTMFQWDTSDWYALGECTLSLDEIEPILLTEEILLKCGAVEQAYHWDFMGYFWKFEAGSLIFHDENYYGSHLPGCDFLHHLQNLYFALTGEELQISL